VENVSWSEAVDFCRRLTDRERGRGTLPPGFEYALPSEAQWEYACRAGTTTAYSFGDDPALLHLHGNYNDKSGGSIDADTEHDDGFERTAPVGSYKAKEIKPNAWGFHDMHGNVNEWCAEALDPNVADYSADATTDPLGTQGTHRVARGGGWSRSPSNCRSANRNANSPSNRDANLGFRPAVVHSRPEQPRRNG
jgi:formylglycine-generating enzyme required for sulfatase activity